MPGRALLLAGGVVTAACASAPRTPPTGPATEPPAACLLTSDSIGAARAVSAAFEDSAEAQRARRAAAVLPPVRLDCEGRPSPGIAVAWSRDTSGRFWTLELARPDSGESLRWTAGALAATWRADPDARAALRWASIVSLVPLDDRRLVLGFLAPRLELPTVFADLALGVESDRAGPAVVPMPPGADLRDAVDRGPDLIVASDPDLLDYARQRPGVSSRALPWSRTYLLVLPAGAPLDLAIPADTGGFRTGLAGDAVRAEARAPAAPGWWDSAAACPPRVAQIARHRDDVIAYPAADRVARALAERLVALASSSDVAARGLPADTLALALRAGTARAFVIAVPTHELVPCRQTVAWPDSAAIIPLVETRAQIVIRRGGPPLVSDRDGTFRVEAR